MSAIEVTFIRHAESEENVKIASFCDGVSRLKSFRLPTLQQMYHSIKILEFDLNSHVSTNGKRQIVDMKMMLNDKKFWGEDIEIIAYSPLARAKETCLSLVPDRYHKVCISTEILREVSPIEHLLPHRLEKRVVEFENWLKTEGHSKVVIVGHSQYFNNLLGMKTLMRNCDVWRATATFPTVGRCKWSEPVLLFRSVLSTQHAFDRLYNVTERRQGDRVINNDSTHGDNDVTNDLDDNNEEPMCRICQSRLSESPERKMLKPCRCSGSVSYVHVDCLNHWRSTSTEAYFRCSICNYNYRIQRTLIAKLLVQERVVLSIAVLMIIVLCFSTGTAVMAFTSLAGVSNQDPIIQVYKLLEIDAAWSRCNYFNNSGDNNGSRKSLRELTLFVYRNSNDVNDMLKKYITLLRSDMPMILILCHPYIATFVHVFVVGAIIIGICGMTGFFLRLLSRIRRGGGQWLIQSSMVVIWMASLGVRALSRLCLIVGCLIATREVYLSLVVQARQWSHYIGDRILEPNS